MTVSSRADSNIDQDKYDETRNVEQFGDGDLKPIYDRQLHNRYMVTGITAFKTKSLNFWQHNV